MPIQEPVTIYDYQPSWVENFEFVSKAIRKSLGDSIIDINHIGSTSIPNMPAKNIIDIQIGVKDFSNIKLLQENLFPLGFHLIKPIQQDHVPFKDFEYMEEGYEKRFFKGLYHNIQCNVHVRVTHAKNWKFAIDFRNYLIRNHEAAKSYAQFKQRLSSTNISMKDYCLIKDPVCDLIYLLFSGYSEK